MQQMRMGVFETNSSSTHSICISTNRGETLNYPSYLFFKGGYFGWEEGRLDTPEEKASYLYSSIISLMQKKDAEDAKNKIYEYLAEEGIHSEFEEVEYSGAGWGVSEDMYVDHPGSHDHESFVHKALKSKKRLLRYLFSERSYILTGNDNIGTDVTIHVQYPHEEYYKGC